MQADEGYCYHERTLAESEMWAVELRKGPGRVEENNKTGRYRHSPIVQGPRDGRHEVLKKCSPGTGILLVGQT